MCMRVSTVENVSVSVVVTNTTSEREAKVVRAVLYVGVQQKGYAGELG